MHQVQQVFVTNGVPTHTFVPPREYQRLLVNLRTVGRGLVIEGPSGIGKTTAIENAIREAGFASSVTKLSARKKEDVEYISTLPELGDHGVVLVDDFHKLPDETKSGLADYMKTLADRSAEGVKVVIVGINNAGENLIQFAHDLSNRLDVISFETEPDTSVRKLVEQGEEALNVEINTKEEIVREARGSFFLAQMLSLEVCLHAGILERSKLLLPTSVSFEAVKARVWEKQSRTFQKRCRAFCRGGKLRRGGRAPYLHILKWLAESDKWTLDIDDAVRSHNDMKGSVGQIVSKGYLETICKDADIDSVLHFDPVSRQITVEDPLFVFYIRNIQWRTFAREVGFHSLNFGYKYDVALSFSGDQRALAESLFRMLEDEQLEVFYDANEQSRILAENVEEYLKPIYQSDARYIVPLLSSSYPTRVWTKFESEQFKGRFSGNAVIPVWFSDAPPGMFDRSRDVGGFTFDPSTNIDQQARELVCLIVEKLEHARGS